MLELQTKEEEKHLKVLHEQMEWDKRKLSLLNAGIKMLKQEKRKEAFWKFQDTIHVPDLYYMKNYKERLEGQSKLLKWYQNAIGFEPFYEMELKEFEKIDVDALKAEDEELRNSKPVI